MGMMRGVLLAASQNRWMRERASRYRFVRRTVARFMPGEGLDDAIKAAQGLEQQKLGTVFTRLGENITVESEAAEITRHYLDVLDRVRAARLSTEISVKPTQLGLDLSANLCQTNLNALIERAGAKSVVWIDMEASQYVDPTLDLLRRSRAAGHSNVGICLQAYLYRTATDLDSLLPLGPAIRLVKGAYMEPPSLAFPHKKDVDENYFALAQKLLSPEARKAGIRAAIATHDIRLIRRIADFAASQKIAKNGFEFQMLYGIQRAEQLRLASEGYNSRVLIAYGSYWYPWFMRRLAERPANLWFVARNFFSA